MKIKIFFKIIFSVGLIVFLILNLEVDKLVLIQSDAFIPFIIAVAITIVSLGGMAFRWKIMITNFLNKQVDLIFLLRFYFIGMFFNIFLPGAIGGDVVRTQRLSKRCNIKIRDATLVTIAERFSGVYGLLILLSFSFLFMNFPERLNLENYLPIWVFRISPLIVLMGIPVFKFLLSKYRLVSSNFFIVKIITISLLAQLGDVTIAYIFSEYFGLGIPFFAFLFIMPLVYIATVLPISLGGLGVREGAFSGLMILYGADSSIAIMISLLMYLVKVGVGIIGYLIYLKEK